MPLPEIVTPTYELEVPSSKKKLKYRPFLVKEQKILILALESNDTKEVIDAIEQIFKNSILITPVHKFQFPKRSVDYVGRITIILPIILWFEFSFITGHK